MIGELLDHYRVLELIGRGAMGVVYKGLDVNLDRQVAIKVMSVEARNDPDFVERFRQEARLQGALNHPNIAVLFDYFIHDGAPVAVMEYIDGESLEHLIRRRGAIPAHESIPIFRQALRGVAAAHRAGIIHRDLKPGNLMLARDDIVKVMDFGIAKRQGSSSSATKASTSIGSPLYMAPEQILGRAVDCRTDIYALGITLYQLLSGQPPFNPRGKAEFVLLNSHVNDLPEPPTVYCSSIPQPLVDAVMRALAKDPDARFQSADEFMQALPDTPAPAPTAAEARVGTGTVPLSRVPSGTVALPKGPTGTVALPRVEPSETVALEFAPPTSGDSLDFTLPAGELAPVPAAPPAASAAPAARDTMMFDYSARTLLKETSPRASTVRSSTASPADTRPPLMRRLRAYSLSAAALLVAILVLGAVLRHPQRVTAVTPRTFPPPAEAPAPASAPAAAEPAPPPASSAAAPAPEAASAPATDVPPAVRAVPARARLQGRWSGAYIDASGRQRLRVVSLSISRVQADGGIEGTLEYQAASGNGECKLHPSGSSYSQGAQRLQLSPEGCTPHYPRELGVPLDFDGVNPQANTLRNGRIEAPTGELIRVRLQRLNGA